MNRSKIIILVLLILLIATNVWWAFQAFDHGITITYTIGSLDDHKQALDQALMIIPEITSGRGSREEIINSMESRFGLSDGLNKDGYIWIGKLGLRFDDSGKLLEVQPAWN
jgi:hypothetical protein